MTDGAKPRLLDLFCGAGGAAMGYHRAGFEVVGVDIRPQPNYPFAFIRHDALHVLNELTLGSLIRTTSHPLKWFGLSAFDAIHASPPCPRFSSMTRVQGDPESHADLVSPTRELLRATGLPYVIENVVGAPLQDAVTLCGAAFALGTVGPDGQYRHLRRHRLFESNIWLWSPGCACSFSEPVGVYGGGGPQRNTVHAGGINRGYMGDKREREEAMQIDWMATRELSDAIPPAYTEFIGEQLLAHLQHQEVTAP